MNNTAKTVTNEVAATDDCVFSDELIKKIMEAEAYMEAHPDEWITAEESIARLRNIIDENV